MAISPASQQTRNLWWLNEHLPPNSNIQISDITSMYTVINVIGPKARELLAELTDVSLKVADFPHMTGKVWVGYGHMPRNNIVCSLCLF